MIGLTESGATIEAPFDHEFITPRPSAGRSMGISKAAFEALQRV